MMRGLTQVERVLLMTGALLVLLGDLHRVIDPEWLTWVPPLDALFASRSIGTTLVLAAIGSWVARRALVQRGATRVQIISVGLSVMLPLWIASALVLSAVAGLAQVKRGVDVPEPVSSESWGQVLTFRWNIWAADHVLAMPAELSGLLLFSVIAHLVGLLVVVALVVPRRLPRPVLGLLAAVAAVAVMGLRIRATEFRDPFILTVDTFARADAFLLGVAAACLANLRARPSAWGEAAVPVVLGAALATAFVTSDQHFWVQLPVTAALAGIALLQTEVDEQRALGRLADSSVCRAVAAAWLAVIATSTPVAVIVARQDLPVWLQPVLVAVLVAVLAFLWLLVQRGAVEAWRRRGPRSGQVSDEDRRAGDQSSAGA